MDALRDNVRIGPCASETDPRLQAPNHAEIEIVADRFQLTRRESHGNPGVHGFTMWQARKWKLEILWHHGDDLDALAVQVDGAAHCGTFPSEAPAPQAVTDHRYAASRAVFLASKGASQGR